MNPPTWQDCFRIMQDQAGKWLSFTQPAQVVAFDVQQREIRALKDTLDYEKFFFVVDVVSCKTALVHGTSKWLGWQEAYFTMMKYCSIIHPTFLAAHMTGICELMKSNMLGRRPVQLMGPRLTIAIALQHASGEYLLFKMHSFPFQYDRQSRVVSYLCEFTLLGSYTNEPFRARITDRHGSVLEWQASMLRRMARSFRKKIVFSNQEFRILARYASQPALTSMKAADIFHIKESTVITYKRRILAKAENYFQRPFQTVKEVASYLREHRLI